MDYTSDSAKSVEATEGSKPSSRCVGCGCIIYDPYIVHVQPDLEWHNQCLRCSKCQRELGNDPSCFVKEGKAYCREDYCT
ncbi:LIM/homeobox protein Lhx5 [Cichlidogyrus casuarinus]|uniref:LIM/homeobox protein Lhx5 n=1 Tax=Cichlidogyrus casuarinus TaxID=1844966 RepID=A0ABD2PRP9_9PLAT